VRTPGGPDAFSQPDTVAAYWWGWVGKRRCKQGQKELSRKGRNSRFLPGILGYLGMGSLEMRDLGIGVLERRNLEIGGLEMGDLGMGDLGLRDLEIKDIELGTCCCTCTTEIEVLVLNL